MKKELMAIVFGILIVIGLATLGLVSYEEEVPIDDGKVNVIVSIVPLSEFVEKVGGQKVDVSVLVPSGASPHTYEPKPSQLVEVSGADMFVKAGSQVEFELVWAEKIIEQNKRMHIVDCSEGIKIDREKDHELHQDRDHDQEQDHDSPHHDIDPHIWLSPKNAKIMVENICDGLIKVDPENKDYYIKNKDLYLAELNDLDNKIGENLLGIENRSFIVFHPAFGHFAKEYELEQISIEVEGKEPSASDIENIIEVAKEHSIKVIFVSPQFNTKTAEVIARQTNCSVSFLDPLAKDYIVNMEKISSDIAQGFK